MPLRSMMRRPDGSIWELGSGGFGRVVKGVRAGVQVYPTNTNRIAQAACREVGCMQQGCLRGCVRAEVRGTFAENFGVLCHRKWPSKCCSRPTRRLRRHSCRRSPCSNSSHETEISCRFGSMSYPACLCCFNQAAHSPLDC